MSLTCLIGFFNGSGLNVMMSNFDPQNTVDRRRVERAAAGLRLLPGPPRNQAI